MSTNCWEIRVSHISNEEFIAKGILKSEWLKKNPSKIFTTELHLVLNVSTFFFFFKYLWCSTWRGLRRKTEALKPCWQVLLPGDHALVVAAMATSLAYWEGVTLAYGGIRPGSLRPWALWFRCTLPAWCLLYRSVQSIHKACFFWKSSDEHQALPVTLQSEECEDLQ